MSLLQLHRPRRPLAGLGLIPGKRYDYSDLDRAEPSPYTMAQRLSSPFPQGPTVAQGIPYRVTLGIRATNATTGFKITTGTSVTCIAVGRFSS